jgi:hypothetical protein
VREAHRLAPRDGEVLGALRLLELGAEMASRRGEEADEIGSRRGEADEIGSRRGEAHEMYCAFTALANPMAASDAAGLGQWAPDTAPAPNTAPGSDTAPVPPAEREVISALCLGVFTGKKTRGEPGHTRDTRVCILSGQ